MLAEAEEQGHVPVIIEMEINFMPLALDQTLLVQEQRSNIQQASETLLSRLDGMKIKNVKTYSNLPYVAAFVDDKALRQLMDDDMVRYIHRDELASPQLTVSTDIVGAQDVWASGYTGDGTVVAIFDTGVDRNHPFFGGRVVNEACFSTNNASAGVSSLCPNGQSTQFGTGAAMDCESGVDGCGHGTHVAGISAGSGANFSGVAPDADIIAVQVFSQFPPSSCPGSNPCVSSYSSDLLAGLNWLYDQTGDYNIVSANLSLGGGRHTSSCDSDPRKSAIDNLRSANVATVIASGNDGYSDALSAPACISTSISVGSTETGRYGGTVKDRISSFSNSASFLDLLAPGHFIESSDLGNSYSAKAGTSMAAPHVAGAWALYRENDPGASVAEVLEAFQTSGLAIQDSRNNITRSRIQIDEAMTLDLGEPDISVTPVSFNVNMDPDETLSEALTISNTGEANLNWSIEIEQNDGTSSVRREIKSPEILQPTVLNEDGRRKPAVRKLHPSLPGVTMPQTHDKGFENGALFQTDFESAEGFNTGPVAGQEGWRQVGPSALQPNISTSQPYTGSQHLQIAKDTNFGTDEIIGAFSPVFGSFSDGIMSLSVQTRINGTGGSDYQFYTSSQAEDAVTGIIYFDYQNNISVYDDGSLVNTNENWTVGEYVEAKIVVNSYEKTISYYYDGDLIYQAENTGGILPDQIAFAHDNWNSGETGNFDQLVVTGEDMSSRWLTVSQSSGTTAPGEESIIDLSFSTEGLAEGSYEAEITVSSNDPVNDIITIPVNLTVGEDEELSVDLYAIPSENVILAGTSFTVDIQAGSPESPVADLAGVGFQLSLDPGIMLVDDIEPGEFILSNADPEEVIFFSEEVEEGQYAAISASRTEAAGGVEGSGTVARLTLSLKNSASGTHSFDFSDVLVTNSSGEAFNVTLNPAMITVQEQLYVWPGDTNNDGIVDIEDVLPIGQFFGMEGPARDSFNITWEAQPADSWDDLPMTFADATGSGKISQNDIIPIGLNFGKTTPDYNEQAKPLAANNPSPVELKIPAGFSESMIQARVALSGRQEAEKIIGFGADLSFDSDFFRIKSKEAGNLLSAENLLVFDHEYEKEPGRYSLALSRLGSSEAVRAYGEILQIEFEVLAVPDQDKIIFVDRLILSEPGGKRSIAQDFYFESMEVTNTEALADLPEAYSLSQNYPNPFNPVTSISFALPERADVHLAVYDLLGRQITTLVNTTLEAGHHVVDFDAANLATGMYMYRLQTASFEQTRTMMLVK